MALTPDELRAARKRMGLTQVELASIWGTTQSAITHWETGRHRIPFGIDAKLRELSAGMAFAGKMMKSHDPDVQS